MAASALAGIVTAPPAGAQLSVFDQTYPACQQATTNCPDGSTVNIQIGSNWSNIIFTVIGGNGGQGGPTGGSAGGLGAQATATWNVSNMQGSYFQINVGAAGGPGEAPGNNPPYGLAGANGLGGAAGGGTGGIGNDDHAGGGGGGSSDVRTCTDNTCDSADIATRIIVAGGGGGGGNSKDGGSGGVGGNGGKPNATAGTAGTPSNCGGGVGATSPVGGGSGAIGAGGSRCVGGSSGAQGPDGREAAGGDGGDTSIKHGFAGGGGGGGLFGGGGGAGAQTPAANDSGGGGGGGGGSSYIQSSLNNPSYSLNPPTGANFAGNGSIQVIAYGSSPQPGPQVRPGDSGPALVRTGSPVAAIAKLGALSFLAGLTLWFLGSSRRRCRPRTTSLERH
jgi:hypothetical protein